MEIQEERVMFVLCTVHAGTYFLKRDYGHTKTDKIHKQTKFTGSCIQNTKEMLSVPPLEHAR